MSEVKAFLESLDMTVLPKNVADKITMIVKDDAVYDYPEDGEEFASFRKVLESKYPQSIPGYAPAGAGEPTEEQAREFMSTLEILAETGDTDAAELLESLRIIYGDATAEGGSVSSELPVFWVYDFANDYFELSEKFDTRVGTASETKLYDRMKFKNLIINEVAIPDKLANSEFGHILKYHLSWVIDSKGRFEDEDVFEDSLEKFKERARDLFYSKWGLGQPFSKSGNETTWGADGKYLGTTKKQAKEIVDAVMNMKSWKKDFSYSPNYRGTFNTKKVKGDAMADGGSVSPNLENLTIHDYLQDYNRWSKMGIRDDYNPNLRYKSYRGNHFKRAKIGNVQIPDELMNTDFGYLLEERWNWLIDYKGNVATKKDFQNALKLYKNDVRNLFYSRWGLDKSFSSGQYGTTWGADGKFVGTTKQQAREIVDAVMNMKSWDDFTYSLNYHRYAKGGGVDGKKNKYDYYEVYDDSTGKSLMIYAINQRDAENIAEELDFDSFEDGDEYNPNEEYAKGGEVDTHVDLFEYYEKQPAKLSRIVKKYMKKFENDDYDYQDSENFLKEVQAIGYTFDYGLDNEPYGLRPVGVKLNELEGFEDMDEEEYAKGGAVKSFFSKAKSFGKSALDKGVELGKSAKRKTEEAIHQKKKDIALGVLSEMGMRSNVSRKEEEKIVNPAYNLIYDKYAKGGEINGSYLDSVSPEMKSRILENIADNYGISVEEAEAEMRDREAEMLYEYITDRSLKMHVYKNLNYAKGGGVGNINWRKHKELVDFERELKSKDDGSRIEDVILNANGDWLVYYVDNSGMTTKRDTKIIQNSYAKGGGISEKITQADLLNQNFKEAKEHIIEIHKRVKLKSGNELLLLKKESGWGIAKYNPKTKKELQWNSFSDKETANYWIDKVDVEKYAKGGAMAEGEDYEYINSFGISDADFQDMVDRYHAGELPDTSLNDKYGEKTVHAAAAYIHAKHMNNQMRKGGRLGFEGLSRKVAEYYSGKKVPKQYQKTYGKTYDSKEAKEVGDKVASKVYRRQISKK